MFAKYYVEFGDARRQAAYKEAGYKIENLSLKDIGSDICALLRDDRIKQRILWERENSSKGFKFTVKERLEALVGVHAAAIAAKDFKAAIAAIKEINFMVGIAIVRPFNLSDFEDGLIKLEVVEDAYAKGQISLSEYDILTKNTKSIEAEKIIGKVTELIEAQESKNKTDVEGDLT